MIEPFFKRYSEMCGKWILWNIWKEMFSNFPFIFPHQQSLLSELFQKRFISKQWVGIFISSGNKECCNGAIHKIGHFSLSLESLCPLACLFIGDIADLHWCRTLNWKRRLSGLGANFTQIEKNYNKYALALRDSFFPKVSMKKLIFC